MKKIILVLIAVCGAVCGLNAQTKAQIEASEKKVMATGTPCNQGTEPFSKFIAQFSTDKTFMDSRLKLPEGQAQKYASLLEPANFKAMTPRDIDGELYYQEWGEMQFAKVYLYCGWVDSYLEHTFEFVRQGDKWYLGKIVVDE